MRKSLLIITLASVCSICQAQNIREPEQRDAFTDKSTVQVVPNMSYKNIRKLYKPRFYKPSLYDHYQPGLSGFLSFLVPGVGQMTCHEGGRGAAFLLSNAACIVGAYSSGYRSGAYICLGAALVIDIVSIVDAVNVAKVKNMYENDLRTQRGAELSFAPMVDCFEFDGTLQPTVGMRLAVNF